MKKLILLIALFFSLLVQSQNIELLKQANKSDLTFTKIIADEIVSGAKTKFVYLDTAESKYLRTTTLIYIKEGLSEVEKKSVEAYIYRYKTTGRYEFRNDNCMSIDFKYTDVGGNPDLEIIGKREYAFDAVQGKFLDLFPFYQKNIEPLSTTEKTTTTGIYSVRKDADGYWYNLKKSSIDGLWYLKNMSSRLN